MKIKTKVRIEDTTDCLFDAKDPKAIETLSRGLLEQDHVVSVRLVSKLPGKVVLGITGVYQKHTEYDVPEEIGQHFVKLKFAVKSK